MDEPNEVTRILQELGAREDAPAELLPLIYDQLRGIARRRMIEERAGHTLQATALVHEAYMRLIGSTEISWSSRRHFFAAAAEAMRRVLIDHARRRDSRKRGSGKPAAPLTGMDVPAEEQAAEQLIAIDEALTTLEAEDERAALIVKLRYFAGLSVAETVEVSGLSERTVMREWAFARARLFQLLS